MSVCVPYTGSKRRSAKKIITHIKKNNPQAKVLYDLFGGGGAISFEACKYFDKVVYNELNTGVVELIKRLFDVGVSLDMYSWVTRDDFHKHKQDNDWWGGFVKTCWSFGNNQRERMIRSAGTDTCGSKNLSAFWICAVTRCKRAIIQEVLCEQVY